MAWRKQGDCEIWMCIGLFVATASLCHCVAQTMNDTSNSSSIREFELRGNSTVVHGKWVNVRKGRILIGRSSPRGAKDVQLPNGTHVDADYQADMGRGDSMQVHSLPRSDSAAVKQLLQMEPKVECTGTSMKLRVQDAVSKPGHALFVDRGSQLSPLPLSKLPVNCGYSLRSTLRGLVLDAPYDGCFVSLEDESYVLSLHWLGLPVRMSCPVMRQSPYNPPMVLCNAVGMEVKMDLSISVNQIKVNYNGHWEPLMEASQRCGFGVVTHPNGVVISICYDPCVQIKDGMFTIELAEDGKVEAYCPQILPSNPVNTQNCGRPIKNISQSKVPPTQFPVYPKNPNSKREPQVSQTPQGQQLHQFPFYQLPPYYQHQLYPPSDPNVNQKPQSQTPKGDVEEVLHPTEPPKPVPSQGQKPQPYKFPIYQLPPYYQHQLFPPSDPNINQKPQSQTPKGDVEEVLNPTEPQKPSSGKPAAPQGQKPLLHQFPFYQLPPYYQHQLFPPSDPNIYQKPQSQTPKGDVEEVLNPTEPQKPSSGKPAAPQGQKPLLHQFPFYQLPPYYQHQLLPPSDPNIYQKPQSQTPKGDVEEVLKPTEPQKPSIPEGPSTGKPAAPQGQKPLLHQFPFYQLPPYHQHLLYPPSDPNIYQKPQSQTPKGDVEEVLKPTEPQKPSVPEGPSTGKLAAPQGQKPLLHQFPFYQLPPYHQHLLYPPSDPNIYQKPQSQTPKGDMEEVLKPTEPQKPSVPEGPSTGKPAAPQGQKPLLYQFPFYQLPPYHQHLLYPPSDPNIKQKPQSQIPKGDVEEVLKLTEPEKPSVPEGPSTGKPAAPQGQKPLLHQFPFYQLPPYHQQLLFPPSDPNINQKPQSQIPKGDVEEVFKPTEPQKPSVPEGPSTGKPAAPQGQKPLLHQFPFYQLPPYYQHQLFPPYDPNVNQKPQSQTPKGDVEEVLHPTEPQKPVPSQGQKPQPYKFPIYQLPPYYQHQLFPPSDPNINQKPQSQTPKGDVEEVLKPTEPQKPSVPEGPSTGKPAAPQGQKPLLHQFPFYQLPPYYQHQLFPPYDPNVHQKPQSQTPKGDVEEVLHPTEPQKPVPSQGQKPQPYKFPIYQLPPYYQHQLFPPSDPNINQKPQSQIPKGDMEEVLKPTEPQKPSVPEGPSTGKPAAPQGQKPQLHQFPFYQLPPYYQHQLFPPSDPNIYQKPQSQTPKGDVEEVLNPTEPQKPSSGKPAAPQGQKPQLHQFPFYQLPPYYQHQLFPPSDPNIYQKPQSQTPKGDVEEVLNPTEPQKPSSGKPAAPQGQKPLLHQFPFYQLPPYYQHQLFPPYDPNVNQKPQSQIPKGDVEKVLNPTEPQKPSVPEGPSTGKPAAPHGQKPQLHRFPFYQLPPYYQHQLFPPYDPNVNQKPQSQIPKGDVEEVVNPTEPQKPSTGKPAAPQGQKLQTPDSEVPEHGVLSPYYQNIFYPQSYPKGSSQEQWLPNHEHRPGHVYTESVEKPALESQDTSNVKPSHSGSPSHALQPGVQYSPFVNCPLICPIGVYNCCPPISFHQHYHHILPVVNNTVISPSPIYTGLEFLSSLGDSNVPVLPTASTLKLIDTSEHHDTSVNPAPDVSGEPRKSWSSLASQSIKFGSQPIMQQYFPPPDGNPSSPHLNYPNTPKELGVPMQPYFLPQPAKYQSLPQNPILQYYQRFNLQQQSEPYNQPQRMLTEDVKNQFDPAMQYNFMPYIKQYAQLPSTSRVHNEPEAHGKKQSQSEHLKQDPGKVVDQSSIPYYMLQDGQSPPHKKMLEENSNLSQIQLPLSDSKLSKPQPLEPSFLQPNDYVLLQQGPPWHSPSSSSRSLLPSTGLGDDLDESFPASSQRQQIAKLYNVKKPLKQDGDQMDTLIPSKHNMPRHIGEQSFDSLPFSAPALNGQLQPQLDIFRPKALPDDSKVLHHSPQPSLPRLNSTIELNPMDMSQPNQRNHGRK